MQASLWPTSIYILARRVCNEQPLLEANKLRQYFQKWRTNFAKLDQFFVCSRINREQSSSKKSLKILMFPGSRLQSYTGNNFNHGSNGQILSLIGWRPFSSSYGYPGSLQSNPVKRPKEISTDIAKRLQDMFPAHLELGQAKFFWGKLR